MISEEYKELNKRAHQSDESWGTTADQYADQVWGIARQLQAKTILDYGCGKQALKKHIPHIKGYDPCIPGLDGRPEPADLVTCIDVLEHVEPDQIDSVLDDLKALTKHCIFLVVCKVAAMKILEDGRNAHLIQEPLVWWLPKLVDRFEQMLVHDDGGVNFIFIGKPYGD